MDVSQSQMLHRGIGKKVRDFRKSLDLRQAELAASVHCSRATLVNVEKGQQQPTIDLLFKLSIHLKCSYRDLLPTEEEIENMKTEIANTVMTPEKRQSIISQLQAKAKEKEMS